MLKKRTLTLMAVMAAASTAALAQTPPTAHKPGLLSRLLHHKPVTTTTPMAHRPLLPFHKSVPGTTVMHGQIIGNKKTHVYHLPGQPGALPAPQNRVYFSSAAAAQAAGYHAMGSSHVSATHRAHH